tara:strand:- start:16095 stop:17948 length:1854 start_codon:yes stop_codon:yes gene_type:complete
VTPQSQVSIDPIANWELWWIYNRETYLNLKGAIGEAGPGTMGDEFYLGNGQRNQMVASRLPDPALVTSQVLPALLKALDGERQDGVLNGTMISLARIGQHQDAAHRAVIREQILGFLGASSQVVRETAVLSLGILGDEDSAELLADLFADRQAGRKAVRDTKVDQRTRAYAGYALALIGQTTADADLRAAIVAEAAGILDAPTFASSDIKVAASMAFALIPLAPGPALDAEAEAPTVPTTRQEQIALLLEHFDQRNQRANKRRRSDVVRSHFPRAMVRLLDLDGEPFAGQEQLRQAVGAHLVHAISRFSPYDNDLMKQGAAMALGQLGTAGNSDLDGEIVDALVTASKDGSQQVRRFAQISLAQVGSRPGLGEEPWAQTAAVRTHLDKLHSRAKTTMRPWAALSLGIFGHHLMENDQVLSSDMGTTLRTAAMKEGNPEAIGAYAIALGLRKDQEGVEVLMKMMDKLQGRDAARGFCAVGLGMMQATDAADPIYEIVEESRFRPDLLRQASTGLALLRQTRTVPMLVDMLSSTDAMATQAALCGALGRIGDRHSVAPLLELLADKGETANTRGFAAMALGMVCDSSPMPWTVELSRDLPYSSSTSTLLGSGSGVLDPH